MEHKICTHIIAQYGAAPITCDKTAFNVRNHGWLCLPHYRMQQQRIPAEPRQPQPVWKGIAALYMTDDQIIADIIATDRNLIDHTGAVETIRFGSVDPSYVRYHNGAS